MPQSKTKRKAHSRHSKATPSGENSGMRMNGIEVNENGTVEEEESEDLGEWKETEVVITREMVDEAWKRWRVKEKGVLDEAYVLL